MLMSIWLCMVGFVSLTGWVMTLLMRLLTLVVGGLVKLSLMRVVICQGFVVGGILLLFLELWSIIAPAVLQAPTPVVESLAPAPVLSKSPAPGGCLSPAPAVFRVGGLQGSVPGKSSTSRRRHDLPLPSG